MITSLENTIANVSRYGTVTPKGAQVMVEAAERVTSLLNEHPKCFTDQEKATAEEARAAAQRVRNQIDGTPSP